jgi:hypothetical protein
MSRKKGATLQRDLRANNHFHIEAAASPRAAWAFVIALRAAVFVVASNIWTFLCGFVCFVFLNCP